MTPPPRPPFGVAQRPERIAALEHDAFDLLVIGGGIVGTGVARDAAMRGLRVALVEQADFASGTSSRSSRLVHGGLRYLENGQLHLVFEASQERRTLMRIAPHIVRPLQFLWPVFDGARIPRWKLRAALTVYDALALFRNVAPHHALSAASTSTLEPALRRPGLRGGATYFDAATDDARLTLLNARAAHDSGAVVASRVRVDALLRDSRAVRGAHAYDTIDNRSFDIAARTVVNATGPWSDTIRRFAQPNATASVRGTKGVHVALPAERVGNAGALTLLSPVDGRVFFVLPSGATTIVGTTDTDYNGEPEAVCATPDDVDYLVRSVNAYFPAAQLTPDDVIAAWAGIRPLIGGDPRHPDALSREHAVTTTAPGLITVSGGKLTTYRVMARDTVDAVQRMLGQPAREARTGTVALPGGAGDLDAQRDAAAQRTGSHVLAAHLVHRYGGEWAVVWSLAEADSALAVPLSPPLPYVHAEVAWAIAREMAVSLGDVLMRRVPLAWQLADHGMALASEIAPAFGWTAADVAEYARDASAVYGPVARPLVTPARES
ncbi:MAG TPA: glycerol-3-phosphate dehydrogenase [Gemmatimonadaceae bacterium]|nr:glycerol-3-phosphate dehydrogenase [Gemmatimonadaceae bacterium]